MRGLIHGCALAASLALLGACTTLQVPVTPGPGEPPIIVEPEPTPEPAETLVRLPLSGDLVTPAEACKRYGEWRDGLIGTTKLLHPDWGGTKVIETVDEAARPWRPLLRRLVCKAPASSGQSPTTAAPPE